MARTGAPPFARSSLGPLLLVSLLSSAPRRALGLSTYNALFAKQMMFMSAAAYCNETSIVGWSCLPCETAGMPLTSVDVFASASFDAIGYVGRKTDGGAVLVFRGSSNIPQWITNLNFLLTPYPGCAASASCQVHAGFLQAWQAISLSAYTAITNTKGLYVDIAGHSLGGAMSTLAALELVAAGYNVRRIHTYGGPRVGNAAYAAAIKTNVIKTADGSAAMEANASTTAESLAVLPMRLDESLLRTTDVRHTPISLVMAMAIERALSHAANADLFTAEEAATEQGARIAAIVRDHANRSTEYALRTVDGDDGDAATWTRAAFSERQLEILAQLRFVAHSAFAGAQFFRVVHYADIVPHLPPSVSSYAHPIEEVWYDEYFGTGTPCSTTNGEDPTCSNSLAFPTSVSDHLAYWSYPLANACM